jgi:23S rRNA (guanosine2251-2'-O)-methyltransferase
MSQQRRRPGQRTEKERRASQDPASAARGRTAGQGGGPLELGSRHPVRRPPGTAGPPSSSAPAPAVVPAGATLIYGRNPVREALRGHRRVRAVWLAPGAPGDDLEQMIARWAGEADRPLPDIRHTSAEQLLALAGNPEHQGVVAAVDPYQCAEPEAILRDVALLVALDEVQDPHNLGAIIRTAEGAGAGAVIPRHRAAEVTAAVVKASAGATEHIAIAQVRNLADFLVGAKQAGFWVYGAAAGAESEYSAQDFRYPTVLVVGSEGQGLGRRVASLCDVMVSLPLAGRVDSLNVSVSTGILLYEAVRQRRAAAGISGPAEPGKTSSKTP